MQVVEQEAQRLLEEAAASGGKVSWPQFHTAWQRVVRRVVLGDSWADEPEFTELVERLRSSVLESLRLWATTPMILRETTMEVEFEHGVMPAGISTLIFAPYFHRDERHLEFAHRFAPENWDRPRGRGEWPLMPFSLGAGICPGRHLVLLLTSNLLAKVVGERTVELLSHELEPGNLPALLNNYGLEFRLR